MTETAKRKPVTKVEIKLKRWCAERTNVTVTDSMFDFCVSKALTAGNVTGWEYDFKEKGEERNAIPKPSGYEWIRTVVLKRYKGNEQLNAKQLQTIVARIKTNGNTQKGGGKKYPITVVDESEVPKIKSSQEGRVHTYDGYMEVNTIRGTHFDHIYERESQIEIVLSAINAALVSQMANRYHCVLFGEPACGKSEILLSVGRMLGVDGDQYLKLDATSTTEAGIKKHLLEVDRIPPVLIIEEIEKTEEKTLRWLLGILDTRGEVRNLNARTGAQQRSVPMLCLATVNDMEKFEGMLAGALASRFSQEIYCPRPTKLIMQRILEREVARVNGKPEWIPPTLAYCCDLNHIFDPRKVIPVCLCGRDALLDGSYQRHLEAVKRPSVNVKA